MLGGRTIVDDSTFSDQLKLLAQFFVMAGYTGLLVCLDEMVNLYKLAHTGARNANYEQILRILNDSLQGSAAHPGFVFGGTPDFLLDTRRGLYSYTALQSRLAENAYATGGLVDYTGPVLRLANLSPEDFYLLLTRLRHVFAAGDAAAHLIPDEGLTAFMTHCSTRAEVQWRSLSPALVFESGIRNRAPSGSWRRTSRRGMSQSSLARTQLRPRISITARRPTYSPAGVIWRRRTW